MKTKSTQTRRKGLSKSRILNHLQCPKRLYLQTYRPKLAEESAAAEQAFAVGHEVGELARRQHPGGLLIEHDTKPAAALKQTREALEGDPKRPLFEATFAHDGVLVRADLLLPDKSGRRLVEVKSSTSVKPRYLTDCAIQAWTIESAGYRLKRILLAHVDTSFVYQGDGDYDGLFHREDVTKDVRALSAEVPEWVRSCRKTLAGSKPKIAVGDQCDDPYPCPFYSHCLGPQPKQPKYPVTSLYRKGKIVQQLVAEGITDLREAPLERLTNPIHQRQYRTVVSGKPELDRGARKKLAARPFPRYFIDFESVNPAVPVWAGTRPYQLLPFQWSCHVETARGKLRHREFLGLPPAAPMRAFAESLIDALREYDEGPVFVYSNFEASRLRELATRFPDLARKLNKIIERIVDLHLIARAHYYHPAMHGSWRLKSVLPTMAPDLDYGALSVQDGDDAMQAYAKLLLSETPQKRRRELRKGLLEYCKLDTLALVRLARHLEGRVTGSP